MQELFTPVVHVPLQDVVTYDGSQLRLLANIVGSPRPEAVWYNDSELLFNTEEIKIDQDDLNNFTLFISNVLPVNAGQYKVVATNQLGTVHSSACVVVNGESLA